MSTDLTPWWRSVNVEGHVEERVGWDKHLWRRLGEYHQPLCPRPLLCGTSHAAWSARAEGSTKADSGSPLERVGLDKRGVWHVPGEKKETVPEARLEGTGVPCPSASVMPLFCSVAAVSSGGSTIFVDFPSFLVKIFLKIEPMPVMLRKTNGRL